MEYDDRQLKDRYKLGWKAAVLACDVAVLGFLSLQIYFFLDILPVVKAHIPDMAALPYATEILLGYPWLVYLPLAFALLGAVVHALVKAPSVILVAVTGALEIVLLVVVSCLLFIGLTAPFLSEAL